MLNQLKQLASEPILDVDLNTFLPIINQNSTYLTTNDIYSLFNELKDGFINNKSNIIPVGLIDYESHNNVDLQILTHFGKLTSFYSEKCAYDLNEPKLKQLYNKFSNSFINGYYYHPSSSLDSSAYSYELINKHISISEIKNNYYSFMNELIRFTKVSNPIFVIGFIKEYNYSCLDFKHVSRAFNHSRLVFVEQ